MAARFADGVVTLSQLDGWTQEDTLRALGRPSCSFDERLNRVIAEEYELIADQLDTKLAERLHGPLAEAARALIRARMRPDVNG